MEPSADRSKKPEGLGEISRRPLEDAGLGLGCIVLHSATSSETTSSVREKHEQNPDIVVEAAIIFPVRLMECDDKTAKLMSFRAGEYALPSLWAATCRCNVQRLRRQAAFCQCAT